MRKIIATPGCQIINYMHRIAFKMTLFPGHAQEYKKRHSVLWPELETALKDAGISDYSIFIDEETNLLFGIMKADDRQLLDELPVNPVMKKWWKYMADIMETNEDYSPLAIPLTEVFHLA
jgi:L-rhamnose mutarotase